MTLNRRSILAAMIAGAVCLPAPSVNADNSSGFQFTFAGFDGNPLPLDRFRDRAVLVVNTASECGFTGQYAGLEQLWQDYKDKGLTVIGVPSNNFGGQEPLKGGQIQNFCTLNYGVTFPLADRTDVAGRDAHPFYKWAIEQAGQEARPRWNFHKILLDRNGEIAATFATSVEPTSNQVRGAIEKVLGARS
ncbi:MAG: glutathione peroxidase [Anderseniella sp.]|nr:glutathione peroxidase [Anderseniella sp.]